MGYPQKKRPSINQRFKKLEMDNRALLEAYDMLHADFEALRIRLARHLAEADIEFMERR